MDRGFGKARFRPVSTAEEGLGDEVASGKTRMNRTSRLPVPALSSQTVQPLSGYLNSLGLTPSSVKWGDSDTSFVASLQGINEFIWSIG